MPDIDSSDRSLEFEVFRTGAHTSGSSGITRYFSDQDLDDLANTLEGEAEVPLVIGHPDPGAPAYGWVSQFKRVGDRLLAAFDRGQLHPAIQDALAGKHYKRVSLQLFAPNDVGNPHPDRFSVCHVGLLGADPPAIPGLKSLAYSVIAPQYSFSFALGAPTMSDPTAPQDSTVMPSTADVADPLPVEVPPQPAAVAPVAQAVATPPPATAPEPAAPPAPPSNWEVVVQGFQAQIAKLSEANDMLTAAVRQTQQELSKSRLGQTLGELAETRPALAQDMEGQLAFCLFLKNADDSGAYQFSVGDKPASLLDLHIQFLRSLPEVDPTAALPEDAPATAALDTSEFSFSIPVGAKVDRGEAATLARLNQCIAEHRDKTGKTLTLPQAANKLSGLPF